MRPQSVERLIKAALTLNEKLIYVNGHSRPPFVSVDKSLFICYALNCHYYLTLVPKSMAIDAQFRMKPIECSFRSVKRGEGRWGRRANIHLAYCLDNGHFMDVHSSMVCLLPEDLAVCSHTHSTIQQLMCIDGPNIDQWLFGSCASIDK